MKNLIWMAALCLGWGGTLAQTTDLTVNVGGFRSDNGTCRVYLFRSSAGFPVTPGKAIRQVSGPVSGGRCTVNLSGIPAGDYAVSVLHDANGNGRLETDFLGRPQEGLGTSNNPKTSDGPPTLARPGFGYREPGKPSALRYIICKFCHKWFVDQRFNTPTH